MLATAALLAACQRDGDDRHGRAIDLTAFDAPCKLLTKADFLAHLNVSPQASAGTGALGIGQAAPLPDLVGARWCGFSAKSSVESTGAYVGVVPAFAREAFVGYRRGQLEKTQEKNAKLRSVKGLGSRALWDSSARALLVLDGDHALALVMYKTSHRESELTRAKMLAEIALERMRGSVKR